MVGHLEVPVKLWVGGVGGWVGGWVGGPYDYSVTSSPDWESGVWSLEFRVGSMELELVWTSSGLSLDNSSYNCVTAFWETVGKIIWPGKTLLSSDYHISCFPDLLLVKKGESWEIYKKNIGP